jgi:hypothetical protein
MGFLKKIFGQSGNEGRADRPYEDTQGIYLYVQCDNCGAPVRVRADKQYDLINEGGSFTWHKTIVDNRCFRPMPTVVRFDGSYRVIEQEIKGGHYITEEAYNALLVQQVRDKGEGTPDADAPADEA